jgi:probable phosphoglycerate mutase
VGEVRYGEWEGGDLKELSQHEMWPGVQFYPSGTRFPGGETLAEVQHRAVAALDALRDRHPDDIIAVVAHADLIRLVVAYYIGIHIDLFQRLVIGTASVTALSFQKMGPRLLAFNETWSLEHLKPKPKEDKEDDSGQAADHAAPEHKEET